MVRIFIAYSSKDLVFKDEIRKRLRPLERAGKASIWDNWDLEGGAIWDVEIREKLEQSDLILLLLSPDALDSDYFYEVEAPIALRRHEAGEAIAVGILLRPCDLKYTPFGDLTKYELLPKKGHPVVHPHWHHADDAYLTIFQEVDVLVEKIEGLRDNKNAALEHLEKEKRKEVDIADLGKKAETQRKKEAALVNAREGKARKKFEGAAAQNKKRDKTSPQNGQVIFDMPGGPEMGFVKGGRFVMGSNEDESSKPVHPVIVPSFWMGKYPITFDEYDAFCVATRKEKPKDEGWGRGKRPVINVSWEDAQLYCQWLSKNTGHCYRLPSEAEWEFSARGGEISLAIGEGHGEPGFIFAGSNDLNEVAWFWQNSGDKNLTGKWNKEAIQTNNCKTQPVGKKRPNELCIYDMSGNVWEWCEDASHENYLGAPSDASAWVWGGDQTKVVLRGGSWNVISDFCSVTLRNWLIRNYKSSNVGFRVVRDL